jgi:hypothetical protein
LSTKITLAFLFVWLVVGCEPDPTQAPTDGPPPVSAGESAAQAVQESDPVTQKLRANAEALCARKSAQSSPSRSWFSCDRAPNESGPCVDDQVEAGREWLEGLQLEAIEAIGGAAALGCFAEATGAGNLTLGQLPSSDDWQTDYVLVVQCARDRMKRVRADASR